MLDHTDRWTGYFWKIRDIKGERAIRFFFYNRYSTMGKRSGNRFRGNKQGAKKVKAEWSNTNIPQDNEIFRAYYEVQLALPKQEF